jgi:molybdopterin-containing oxidoreductase family iron-sulfur binding subunit
LYDPDRAAHVRHGRTAANWIDLAAALAPAQLQTRAGARGAGLLVLVEPTSSPLDGELLDRVRSAYPDATVMSYAPLMPPEAPVAAHYDLRNADVVVSIDSEFLTAGPFHLRYAREFAERRRPESSGRGMNRLYAIESSMTPTGAIADHRLALRPSAIVPALERLLAAVQEGRRPVEATGDRDGWLLAAADDLRASAGRSLIVAAPHLSARAQSLAFAANAVLGNVDRTLWFTQSPLAGVPRGSPAVLADLLSSGQVHTLVCIGPNPAYATPGHIDMAALIRRVAESVYVGLYENETAGACTWAAPAAHFLESWGDARAYDGTLSLVQPLIEPLHGGRTVAEVLSLLAGAPEARAYDLLRDSWRRRSAGADGDFEDGWRRVLARGFVEGSGFSRTTAPHAALDPSSTAVESPPMEIVFRSDPRVRDGAFANNAWLQELPDAMTTLTWGNAAHISPFTAQRIGVADGEIVGIQVRERAIQVPAILVPGHADDCVTLHFGYGREGSESIARDVGVSVWPIWPGETYAAEGALSRIEGAHPHALALTQPHHSLNTSDPARDITAGAFASLKGTPPHHARTLPLYEATEPDGRAAQQWGMTIDLGACLGCGACMVACQAENNVPTVGRDQVLRGREMHWLRLDWYPKGGESGHASWINQPMLCQHCEKAPCEYVCPVEATVHSSDGLNEMVYNRCVGTRFCSNNCPYKVRRFNWLDFNADVSDLEALGKNPDVTVRERGVMEKCTFCVQRIRQADIAATIENRPLRGDDVRTACQQACPTRAIVFGSITDADSELARERASARAYAVLDELDTQPRVLYLARVRNPNPALGAGS